MRLRSTGRFASTTSSAPPKPEYDWLWRTEVGWPIFQTRHTPQLCTDLGDRTAAAAAEAALAAAEPDRLLFPFAVIGTRELLDTRPRHETAHGALLADLAEVLRGAPGPDAEAELLPPPEEPRASELRVLRYLPTNLTRPEIARELYVSINTVNTHIRNIYSKLGGPDRSSAVKRARELRLLSTARR